MVLMVLLLSRLAAGPILDQVGWGTPAGPFRVGTTSSTGGLNAKTTNFCFTFLQEAVLVHRWIMIAFIAFLLLVWIPIGFMWCLVGAGLAMLRQRIRYYRLSKQ